MGSSEAPSFQVFRPLRDDDFRHPEFQVPLTELVHGFFAEVEAAALPAPTGATVATEKDRLWQALDAAAGQYDYWPGGFSAVWVSKALVPLAEGDDSPTFNVQTRIEAFTELDRSANPELVDDVSRAAWLTSRKGLESVRKTPETRAAILGVNGRQVRRWPPRYEYEGDDEIDCQLRRALGGVMFAAAQVEVKASTSVDMLPVAVDLGANRVFWLQTARRNSIDPEPVVPADAQLAHFRVLNELVARAAM